MSLNCAASSVKCRQWHDANPVFLQQRKWSQQTFPKKVDYIIDLQITIKQAVAWLGRADITTTHRCCIRRIATSFSPRNCKWTVAYLHPNQNSCTYAYTCHPKYKRSKQGKREKLLNITLKAKTEMLFKVIFSSITQTIIKLGLVPSFLWL